MNKNSLIPYIVKVIEITQDTESVKSFKVVNLDNQKPFQFKCGQCAMISYPGISEAMISITSSPLENNYLEFSIKKVGILTSFLHDIEIGQQLTVRGPFGRPFPVDTEFKNKDLLFIAGGIGIAPLRSVINYVLNNRNDYGTIDIVYGAKNSNDFIKKDEIKLWQNNNDTSVYLTIDNPEDSWDNNVGFIPDYIKSLNFKNNKIVIMCGPPIMIKLTNRILSQLNFLPNNIYITLEMKMKCGIGQCGRCNIGNKYVCKDGPVFTMNEISELPDEY